MTRTATKTASTPESRAQEKAARLLPQMDFKATRWSDTGIYRVVTPTSGPDGHFVSVRNCSCDAGTRPTCYHRAGLRLWLAQSAAAAVKSAFRCACCSDRVFGEPYKSCATSALEFCDAECAALFFDSMDREVAL